jgi:hypothetical protein
MSDQSITEMPLGILTDTAIASIANAVFVTPGAEVLEAYSDFGAIPRRLDSVDELVRYIHDKLSFPQGMAYFFVVYPDMAGCAVRKTINLKPNSVPGQTFRYTWEGWGLISVILRHAEQPNQYSRVAANSKKRAEKWKSTFPDMPSPDTWNWAAVESHARRLRRVLKSVV